MSRVGLETLRGRVAAVQVVAQVRLFIEMRIGGAEKKCD